MTMFTKLLGVGTGATVGALMVFATLGTSHAATVTTGFCQSSSVAKAIDCCNRWVKTPDGINWRHNGGSCSSSSVVCKGGGGGETGPAITHVVAPKKICYLKKKKPPIIFNESHDHQPPSRGNPTRGQNGNVKP